MLSETLFMIQGRPMTDFLKSSMEQVHSKRVSEDK